MDNKTIPVRLVLSGGGARGFAHLGIIKALLELNFKITAISGVSAGAVAGAFICNGFHPDEILKIFLARKPFDLAAPAFKEGLLSTRNLEKILSEYLPENFEDLRIPLNVVITDLLSGKWMGFSEGKLIPVVTGSCAIPGLFRPVPFKGLMMVDGGIVNNLPVEVVPAAEGKIAALHVNPVAAIDPPASTFRILERTFHMAVMSNTIPRISVADVFIEPMELSRFRVFDFKRSQEMFNAGYDYVILHGDEIIKSLKV